MNVSKNNPDENSGLEMVENNQKISSKNFQKQFNNTVHEGGCESNCHFPTIECCHGNKGIYCSKSSDEALIRCLSCNFFKNQIKNGK